MGTIKKSEKEVVNLAVKKLFDLEDYSKSIGFSGSIFMMFGLPTRKPEGNPAYWTKKTSYCELTITRNAKFEMPYGCYARMNQIFIDTEVKTKSTNVVDVGSSFRQYAYKLGYKDGKANRELVKQLINYVTCAISIIPNPLRQNHFVGVQSTVANHWDITFDVRNPEQLMLGTGEILLTEEYARWIYDHAAPIDMNIINIFKRNPLALDFYRYLTYRNNGLYRPVTIPDAWLFEHLGAEQQNDRCIRERLKGILKLIQIFWPVKAKFEDGHFELKPSPPAIPKKFIALRPVKPMKIVERPKDEKEEGNIPN